MSGRSSTPPPVLRGFVRLKQIISQVMTLIKPWQAASESLSILEPFTRSPGTRVNILIYPVHCVFYDGGRADAGCEEPLRSRVRGRVQFISQSSQEHEDSITDRVCAAGRMKKCQPSNESVHRWFLYCPQRTHTAIHSPSVILSLTRGAQFLFFFAPSVYVFKYTYNLMPFASLGAAGIFLWNWAPKNAESRVWIPRKNVFFSSNISVAAIQDSALFVTKHKHLLWDILKVLLFSPK